MKPRRTWSKPAQSASPTHSATMAPLSGSTTAPVCCDNFLYERLQGRAGRAVRVAAWVTPERDDARRKGRETGPRAGRRARAPAGTLAVGARPLALALAAHGGGRTVGDRGHRPAPARRRYAQPRTHAQGTRPFSRRSSLEPEQDHGQERSPRSRPADGAPRHSGP